jgi:hypothetical protein
MGSKHQYAQYSTTKHSTPSPHSCKTHLDVPLPESLGRGEHSSSSAHVSESSLSGPGGTATSDTGDTGNSSSSTPRLGRVLVSGVLGNSVSLSLVLVHRLCGGEEIGISECVRGVIRWMRWAR